MTTWLIDASHPADAPLHDTVRLGTSTSPAGVTIGINSRFLTRNGKPWTPVMGELHYARVPEHQWDDALAKVKAAGVDIVSSYVIWRYHEPLHGQFDWRARRDLRHFLQLCQRHALHAFVRVGPWVHAEVRYGGLPDWVVDQTPTRSDDPLYLQYVQRFFAQIAARTGGSRSFSACSGGTPRPSATVSCAIWLRLSRIRSSTPRSWFTDTRSCS